MSDPYEEIAFSPELQWVNTHDWHPATYYHDVLNIKACQRSNDLRLQYLAQDFARRSLCRVLPAYPGVFEAHHLPAEQPDPVLFLHEVKQLVQSVRLLQSHHIGNDPLFSFSPAWLASFVHPSIEMTSSFGMLLQAASTNVPIETRLDWLANALDYSLTLAMHPTVTRSASSVICAELHTHSVNDERCTQLVLLWCAMVLAEPQIDPSLKDAILLNVLGSDDYASTTPEELLQLRCASLLPHWAIISELGLSVHQARAFLTAPDGALALPEQLGY